MKQYRATVMATRGMVTTPHYLATQAGLKVLQDGGNAIEVSIAIASTIAVVYPHMNTIGGDNFWLIYNSKENELIGINGSGKSGEKATIDFYQSKGLKKIPARGPLAANTVPGAISGWGKAYEYSVKKLNGQINWETLLEQSIHYAKEGFPVTPSQSYWTKINLDESDLEFRGLQRFEQFRKIFLKNGQPFEPGDIMIQKDLANTLEKIASHGANYFYDSELTRRMVESLRQGGGLLTIDDFKQHTSDFVKPISVPYRDTIAYNLPPNTQGMASLSILNILNHIDFTKIQEGSSKYYHVLVEAIKYAFLDRDKYLTDPTIHHIPLDELLSKERGEFIAKQILDNQKANSLDQMDSKGDTVWFGVVDEQGNAVSCIQSIYHEFGSGFIPEGTGVLLQNRGSYFSLNKNHVNSLQPRKRTFHTLNPAMLCQNGKPLLVYGTMGGEGQPQTQAALVTRIIDYRMNPQQAIEAPRWLYGRTWGASTNTLKVENRINESIQKELTEFGHEIEVLDDFTDTMGHAGAIYIDPKTNVKFGGQDPRGDGIALGY